MKTKAEEFKEQVGDLISQLEDLINEMPYKGDRCDQSQKVCLSQALYDFEKCVNGVMADDFKPIK